MDAELVSVTFTLVAFVAFVAVPLIVPVTVIVDPEKDNALVGADVEPPAPIRTDVGVIRIPFVLLAFAVSTNASVPLGSAVSTMSPD